MIDESQTLRLLKSCKDWSLHQFFGSHCVPRSESFTDALERFFKHVYINEGGDEDEWEDLDA